MDFKEIECEGVKWIILAEDRSQWRTLVEGQNSFYQQTHLLLNI